LRHLVKDFFDGVFFCGKIGKVYVTYEF